MICYLISRLYITTQWSLQEVTQWKFTKEKLVKLWEMQIGSKKKGCPCFSCLRALFHWYTFCFCVFTLIRFFINCSCFFNQLLNQRIWILYGKFLFPFGCMKIKMLAVANITQDFLFSLKCITDNRNKTGVKGYLNYIDFHFISISNFLLTYQIMHCYLDPLFRSLNGSERQ